jgi:Spy/CpxP family protein refolding chaperone
MKQTKAFLVQALAAIVGVVVTASAQSAADNPPKTQPPQSTGKSGRGTRPVAPGGMGLMGAGIARVLSVLTEEQRASLREAMGAQRAKAGDLERRLHEARVEVFNATITEKFDEDVVRQKALALARLEAELTVLRAKALTQMHPPLTAEQIEQIKNPGSPGTNEGSGSPARRRHPEVPRDENGLPPKDVAPSAQPKAP